jgi:hypothetical protein
MKPKTIYLVLCCLGIIVPYAKFIPWLLQHGFSATQFWHDLFANQISAFFVMDVLVAAIVLIVFSRIESFRVGIQGRWMVILAIILVGVSLGLPLFLYLRELKLECDPAVV